MSINWSTTNLELDIEAQQLAALEISPSITHAYLKRCSEIKNQLIQNRDRARAVNNLMHETSIKVYRAAFLEDVFTIIRDAFQQLEKL